MANVLDASTEIRSRKYREIAGRKYETRIFATVVTLANLAAQVPPSGSFAAIAANTEVDLICEDSRVVEDFDVAGRHAIIVVYSAPLARGDVAASDQPAA